MQENNEKKQSKLRLPSPALLSLSALSFGVSPPLQSPSRTPSRHYQDSTHDQTRFKRWSGLSVPCRWARTSAWPSGFG